MPKRRREYRPTSNNKARWRHRRRQRIRRLLDDEGPQTPHQIALAFGYSKRQVSRSLTEMQRLGFVCYDKNPETGFNGRVYRLKGGGND